LFHAKIVTFYARMAYNKLKIEIEEENTNVKKEAGLLEKVRAGF
jgi:stress response protein YsnF